jgi:hypothetical protein
MSTSTVCANVGVVQIDADGVLPTQVKSEQVDRLAVAGPGDALQNHHCRHDVRRHRAPPDLLEQLREGLVREQRMPLLGQQSVDRTVAQPPLA